MRISVLSIPVMTLVLNAVIFTKIPILREVVVFFYLSFVPGFTILKLLKLKDLSLLNSSLLSVGLSIATSMFLGLAVNQLLPVIGFTQPLSIVPLAAAISIFTLIVFFVAYWRDSSKDSVQTTVTINLSKTILPLALVLIALPIFSVIGALYVNIPMMIVLFVAIVVLIVLSITTEKIMPKSMYPFLIFSISISLLLLSLLMSRYSLGDDVNLEFYVFRITQLSRYWGPINSLTHSYSEINYNSMLSVTILPTFYSVLMSVKDEILFKILYSFILSLVPLTLYSLYKKETSKHIALLSTLFFIFSINAFFGELTSLSRQIVAEFFLVLSVLLWLDKTLPTREKRILLLIFGVSIGVSHYAIAIVYVIFVSLIVFMTSLKPKFDAVFNPSLILSIFGITIFYYLFSSGSLLTSIINIARGIVGELVNFNYGLGYGSVGAVTELPEVFTIASWVNLTVSGVVYVLLAIGAIAAVLVMRRKEISSNFTFILVSGAFLFAVSILFPTLAATLNFTRFNAISFLFLSPCLVIGALSFLRGIHFPFRKNRGDQNENTGLFKKQGKKAMTFIVVLLAVYLLSQSGFVNYVTGGAIHSQTFDYQRMEDSSSIQTAIQFHGTYIQPQDVFSAVWLSEYVNKSSLSVYSDGVSQAHVLTSQGLIPWELIHSLTNSTKMSQGSYAYIDSLSIEKGITRGFDQDFNTTEIIPTLSGSNVIYSNGNSEIFNAAGSR